MTYPIIRVDLFPASAVVKTSDGEVSYPNARVIVTQDQAFVFTDSPTGPKQAWVGRLDEFDGRNTIGYTATLADESVISFRRSGGCGCGSRLRGFRPFAIMAQAATTE